MDLTPKQFRLVASIFAKACEIPEKERPDFLDDACRENAILRTQVQQLLEDDAQPAFSLASPPFEGVLPAEGAAFFEDENSQSGPPERIGNYRIVKVLGEGGFGVVYLAEQENPKRNVALKVLKPHLVSGDMLRRFEYEARLLGRLRHPGIAHIYEAGTVAFKSHSGMPVHRPFFAMELVRGKRLTTHANDSKLGTRQRLALLQMVCEAVQHAHLQGVIHRDLKPDNILVDDSGQPKILDFGVARAIDSDIQMTTLRTDIGQLIGTIPYMSPEQTVGDSSKLDVRSDVYTMGVIGYELLVGRLPHDLSHKTVPEAVRIIQNVQPSSLSSVNRVFRGDLDTMFAKALEKDKTRRYQSAAEFAADLDRYLNDQPILARPTSTIYQFRKFAKRNRTLVGGVAATFVALVIGVIATTSQAVRAQAEREIAEGQRNRAVSAEQRAVQRRAQAEAVTEFLTETLASADPEATLGREMSVREMLDRASTEIDSAFPNQPLVEAAVRATIGRTYISIGNLGEAEKHLTKALQIRQESLDAPDADLASSVVDLGTLLENQGDYAGAMTKLEAALAMLRELYGDVHDKIASTLLQLGGLLVLDAKNEAAERPVREALTIYRKLHGDDHPAVLDAMGVLGEVLYHKGDADAAEPMLRKNVEAGRRVYGEGHPSVAHAALKLGWFYFMQGRYDDALPFMREAAEIHRAVYGDAHPHFATALNSLARVHQAKGSFAEAESLYREALSVRRAYAKGDHPDVAGSINDLGTLMYYQGDENAAARLFREALDMGIRLHGRDHATTAMNLNNLAFITSDQRKAVSYYREAIEIQRKLVGETHPDLALSVNNLARTLWELGEYEESETLFRESLGIRRKLYHDAHPDIAISLRNIGDLMMDKGDVAGAIQSHRQSVTMMREALGNDHARVSTSLMGLGNALVFGGDAASAEPHLREAVAIREKLYAEGHWKIASAESSLGACMAAMGRFAEAEPGLVACYERVKQQKGDENRTTNECLERVIELYESWDAAEPGNGYDAKAAEWRAKSKTPANG